MAASLNIAGPTNIVTGTAVGDGVTDDTIALQALLNAVALGQMVVIPPGTYLVSQPLSIAFTTNSGNNWMGISGYGARIQSNIAGITAACSTGNTAGKTVLTFNPFPSTVNIGYAAFDQTATANIGPGNWVANVNTAANTVTLNGGLVGTVNVGDTIWFGPPVLNITSTATVRYLVIQGLKVAGSGFAKWYHNEGDGIFMNAGSNIHYIYDIVLRDIAVEGCGGNGFHICNDIFESDLYFCCGRDNGGSGLVFENNSALGSGVISAMKVYGGSWGQNGAQGIFLQGSGSSGAPYDVDLHGCYILENGKWGVTAENHIMSITNCGFENNWTSAGSFANGQAAVYFQVEAALLNCTAASNQYQTGLVYGYLQGGRVLSIIHCEIDGEGVTVPTLARLSGGSGGTLYLDDASAQFCIGSAPNLGTILPAGCQLHAQVSIDSGSIGSGNTYTFPIQANADRIIEITLKDKADSNTNGQWIVMGNTTIRSVTPSINCSLAYSSANLVLTNSGTGAIDFVGMAQFLR